MSPKARRLANAATVEHFAWKDGGLTVPSLPATAQASIATRIAPDPPDQQQHLAALEREAFTKGYAQGERAGLEAGGKRAEAMLRRLTQTLEELSQLRATLIRQTERQMVQLAVAIARRVLGREVRLDADLVTAMARVALDRLGEEAPATIRLNPEDYAITVAKHGEGWAGGQVKVVSDPAVSRGGCLVASEYGSVDAGVEAQFEELTRALFVDENGERMPGDDTP